MNSLRLQFWSLESLALKPVWTGFSCYLSYEDTGHQQMAEPLTRICKAKEGTSLEEEKFGPELPQSHIFFFLFLKLEYTWFTVLCFCCITVWISHMYTYIPPSWASPLLHPTPLGHPRALNWAPCAVQLLPTSQLFNASQSLPLHLQEAKLRAHLLCNRFRRRELRRSQLHTTNFSFLTWQCVKSRFNPSAKEYEGGELPEGLCSTFVCIL